jgi:hypothetical protein
MASYSIEVITVPKWGLLKNKQFKGEKSPSILSHLIKEGVL